MTAHRESTYPGDWLKSEAEKLRSRRNVVVGAVAVVSGQVVEGPDTGILAAAGTNPIIGVVLYDAAIGAEAIIIWSDAIVNAATINLSGQTAAFVKTGLLNLGIRVSDGIGLSGSTNANETQPGPSAPAS